MARKMNKKTRNTLSGILVGVASVFAVINFADIPAEEANSFVLTTLLFFVIIVVLALLAVTVFKLLAWVKRRAIKKDDAPWTASEEPDPESSQVESREDRSQP